MPFQAPLRDRLRALACGAAGALALAAAAPAQALFDDEEARQRIEALKKQVESFQASVEERVAGERRSMVEIATQLEQLRAEIARLRGQIEVMAHQLETAEKRQKDLYLDIDTRLRKLEQPGEQGAGGVAEAPASPAETKVYEAALNEFKLGRYGQAISGFQGFLLTYPKSALAPSAQYWIGNAHYARRDYKNAIAAQHKLIASWPTNAKVPDALLNVASSQEATGDSRGARRTLQDLVEKFPDSPAAASAKQRLAQGGRR